MPKNMFYVRQIKVVISKHFAVTEKYYYIIILHMDAAITVGSLALIAGTTTLLSYFIHICGMFKIAR